MPKSYKFIKKPAMRKTQKVGVEKFNEKSPRLNLLYSEATEKNPESPSVVLDMRKKRMKKVPASMMRN